MAFPIAGPGADIRDNQDLQRRAFFLAMSTGYIRRVGVVPLIEAASLREGTLAGRRIIPINPHAGPQDIASIVGARLRGDGVNED